MNFYPVLRMGDPHLYRVSDPLGPPVSPDWFDIVTPLVRVMRTSLQKTGGIGLAAPQIGFNLRVVLISVPAHRMHTDSTWPEGVPLTAIVDPDISITDQTETKGWEACLSLPGLKGHVPRPHALTLKGWTETGQKLVWHAHGYHARVIQHECDHLDGILYPQRLKNVRDLVYADQTP